MNDARSMKRRRAALFLVGLAMAASAVLLWPTGPKEPVYQEKTITQWIRGAHDVGVFEQTDELKAAMLAMGTNAVPFLLDQFT
ncbi:MAG TPA: hypothetical protein VNM37_02380, partial [Candidatus Dormibacteraeota bacterium]|nr:hypothetical protein [Candidatus Dormibacteraeota bacterium]